MVSNQFTFSMKRQEILLLVIDICNVLDYAHMLLREINI